MTVSVPAYAKINLFLDIKSLRDDGYHNIISYMQAVSLADKVTVSYAPSASKTITVSCNNSAVPLSKDNLAYKAADIFSSLCGDINISIEKNIPMEAGLAGGSSDAAATLVALNSLSGNTLIEDELIALGAILGADVPFCIKGGAAIAEGVGEILAPAPSMPYFPIVIAKKGEGMSTPAAYKALDQKYNKFIEYEPHTGKMELLLSSQGRADAESFSKGLFNIFEAVVEEQRSDVTSIKTVMTANGAVGAMMSGSGTSVFGLFKNEESAQKALLALKAHGADAYLCYPVN